MPNVPYVRRRLAQQKKMVSQKFDRKSLSPASCLIGTFVELQEHELRLDVPWKLSKYNGFTIEDNLKSQMNRQINLELQAFYTYLSMVWYSVIISQL